MLLCIFWRFFPPIKYVCHRSIVAPVKTSKEFKTAIKDLIHSKKSKAWAGVLCTFGTWSTVVHFIYFQILPALKVCLDFPTWTKTKSLILDAILIVMLGSLCLKISFDMNICFFCDPRSCEIEKCLWHIAMFLDRASLRLLLPPPPPPAPTWCFKEQNHYCCCRRHRCCRCCSIIIWPAHPPLWTWRSAIRLLSHHFSREFLWNWWNLRDSPYENWKAKTEKPEAKPSLIPDDQREGKLEIAQDMHTSPAQALPFASKCDQKKEFVVRNGKAVGCSRPQMIASSKSTTHQRYVTTPCVLKQIFENIQITICKIPFSFQFLILSEAERDGKRNTIQSRQE